MNLGAARLKSKKFSYNIMQNINLKNAIRVEK